MLDFLSYDGAYSDVLIRDVFGMPLYIGRRIIFCTRWSKRKIYGAGCDHFLKIHIGTVLGRSKDMVRNVLVEDSYTKSTYTIVGRRDCCYFDEVLDSPLLEIKDEFYEDENGYWKNEDGLEVPEIICFLENLKCG